MINSPHKPLPPAEEEAWQRNLTRQFFKDLSNYTSASPVVIFFDQYEKADQLLKNWLTQIFLPHVSIHYPIIVVISGRESIEPLPSEKGCRRFPLKGVNVDWYHRYVEDCNVDLDSQVIDAVHDAFKGRPKDFVEFVKARNAKGGVQ